MTYHKHDDNYSRLLNLKRASLKYKESMLNYQIKKGVDDKTIAQSMREISKLKSEIKNL